MFKIEDLREEICQESKVLVVIDIILVLTIVESLDIVVIREVMEVLVLLVIVIICFMEFLNKEVIMVTITKVEEEAGIKILEIVASTIAYHLEILNLSGMLLSHFVKFVLEQVILLIFAKNLKSSLLLEPTSHYIIRI